jgi:hypothetical protein
MDSQTSVHRLAIPLSTHTCLHIGCTRFVGLERARISALHWNGNLTEAELKWQLYHCRSRACRLVFHFCVTVTNPNHGFKLLVLSSLTPEDVVSFSSMCCSGLMQPPRSSWCSFLYFPLRRLPSTDVQVILLCAWRRAAKGLLAGAARRALVGGESESSALWAARAPTSDCNYFREYTLSARTRSGYVTG